MTSRPHLTARFLTILERHKGLSEAISVPEMAEQLGLGRGKSGQRVAQLVKRDLVEKGHLIGSSCGKRSGWYQIETADELNATLHQYRSRWHSLGMLMQRTKRHYVEKQSGQMGMY